MSGAPTTAVLALALVLGLFYLLDAPDNTLDMSKRPVYDVTDVKAPRLNNWSWQILSRAVHYWPLNRLFMYKFKTDSEFEIVNRFAALNTRFPTFQPIKNPTPEQRTISQREHESMNLTGLGLAPSSPSSSLFAYWTIEDYARAYRSGKVSPVDVARRILGFIKEGAQTSAGTISFSSIVIRFNETQVIEEAEASAARFKVNKPLGILDGVPFALKDEFAAKGYGKGYGTKRGVLGSEPSAEDGPTVAPLRQMGAVLIGITNMVEFGVLPTGHNENWGTPPNPYGPTRFTGGSSSGSAAAVSIGLVPFAVGADGGGSIRIPSALTGIFGLKPTWGRIPFPIACTVAHAGPLAASAKDAAIAYAVMAAPHPSDPSSLIQPPVHLANFSNQDLTGLRIGIYQRYFEDADQEIVQSCIELLNQFVRRGAVLVDIEIRNLQVMDRAHKVTITSEFATSLHGLVVTNWNDLSGDAKLSTLIGSSWSSKEYVASQKIRTYYTQLFDEIFQKVDVIATPSTAIVAPEISPVPRAEEISRLMRFITMGNFLGLPAITIPAGYTAKEGLPIGFQFHGRYWEEHTLLQLAHVAEAFVERKRPKLFVDVLGPSIGSA